MIEVGRKRPRLLRLATIAEISQAISLFRVFRGDSKQTEILHLFLKHGNEPISLESMGNIISASYVEIVHLNYALRRRFSSLSVRQIRRDAKQGRRWIEKEFRVFRLDK